MKETSTNNDGQSRRGKYPIRCIDCGKKEVYPAVIPYSFQKNHGGRVYDLRVDDLPVCKCRACGEVSFDLESDDRMVAALRAHLTLLTPDQIRANLEALKLSQREAAEALGIAAETLSRWLSGGMVQSRAMDNLLRAFFGSPEVRAGLHGNQRSKFGEQVAGAA
jgi:putative zinc finger/helix-turn-helix YgiT family protein